ncbi:hypothetical protein Tco_0708649 [Tanacetum coccineum]
MIKYIDQQLLERRIMRSLEKFVGGRNYGTDVLIKLRLNALTVIEGAILQGMYSTKKSKEQDRDVGYEQKHQKDWSDTELGLESIEAAIKLDTGYGDQLNENDSSGSELFNSVFDSRSSDGDDNQTNDRVKG